MTDKKPAAGTITWIDLTVDDADKVRDFYSEVVGWEESPVSMGDYDDYAMIPPSAEQPAAGICHARGVNKDQPAVWMIYINVENLENSLAACTKNGGEVISGPRDLGKYGRMAVIKDPAGAIAGLFEPAGE